VLVEDGRISAVGPYVELVAAHPDMTVHGGPDDIITPGFVNTHGHFSEGLITGIAEQYTLWEWIRFLIDPVSPHLTEEMAYVGTLLAGIQMLQTGITVANDMFVCDPGGAAPVTPGVVRALDELGLRGVVSYGAGDRREGNDIGALLEEHTALREAAEASRLSRFRVGVGAVGAQTDELFAESIELAVGGGHGVHIHLHEIREEVTATRSQFGVTAVEHCAQRGLFGAPTRRTACGSTVTTRISSPSITSEWPTTRCRT
jgi:5-methylthioadenosine/S-adenosylhomocysteine deaminase